jgi:hypothetical protein
VKRVKFKDITLLIENKVGILKEGRFILPLSIMVELAFFTLCLINAQLLLRTMLVLPSLFIIPGALLLTVLRRSIDNIIKLTVESFFVSILMSVLLTSIMLALGLPLIPFNYSLAILIVTLFLSIIALIRKIEFKPSESGTLLVIVAFLAYVALLAYFSGLPRLFTPDETSYIFSVRMGILDGAVPPMGVRPNTGEINALFHGRYFWTYLLASFIGSTGLPAHQAGLLGASFLVVTALASSLFVEKKWLRTAVFTLVTLNPLLLLFSALTLNDLAISFYAVFSVLFFVKSFSKNGDNVSINIRNLLCSLLGLIVLTMIKPNLLVFVVMWIILVFIMFRYKFYKQNWKYKVSLIAVVLPVLIYELCIDVPYVVSVWVLKNSELGGLFSRFLFISPAERFLGWFSAPWWNPAAPTLFTQGFANYMDYFYRILTPESLSILVSAIILALPILILSRNLRKKLDKTVLILLVILSMWLFYFEALSSANLSGASRYSLWMIPLWIPLAVIVLQDIIKDESPLRKLLSVSIAALILLWVNIWLSKENGGVFVGYGLSSRLWTAPAITIQFILLTVILSLLLLRNYLLKVRLNISKKLSAVTPLNLRRNVFALAIILMLLNGVYFSFQFVESSQRFEDHGLIAINNALDNVSSDSNIVFANNYIYMRPYVNDELLNRGLLLPPPDTEEEFLKLINVAPNNTLFLISNDQATTWYEYGNKYIKNYSGDDILTSDKPTVEDLLKFNLSDAILHMTFDDMNDIISDHSIYKNNGLNDGAQIVEGYSGKALHFNDDEHVTIPNDDTLNVQNAITISFFASIDAAEPGEGHMILSKGYAPINGSYDICIYNSKIYFELSKTNYLSIPIGEYLGEWHHFIFTYNGERMEAIIDGVVVAAKSATGAIKNSNYAVEIGRDSERKACYFNGTIDELQISGKPLNLSDLANTYSKHYAIKILTITGNNGDSTLFKTMNLDCENDGGNVHVDNVEMTIKNDFAVNLDLKLTSDFPTNTTILISTDRFTNVYVTNLTTGTNNVTFEYPYITDSSLYGSGGPYWVHLAQTRITIVVGETIVYNNSISPLIQTSINIYLMLIAGIVLTVYLLITYIKQKLL